MQDITSSAQFQTEVIESNLPVLVDFWAPWCGPCKMLAPVLDQLSVEMEGKAKFVKVDTDTQRELATRYNVRSVPTILLFKNGEVQEQIVGASVSKGQLKTKIEALD